MDSLFDNKDDFDKLVESMNENEKIGASAMALIIDELFRRISHEHHNYKEGKITAEEAADEVAGWMMITIPLKTAGLPSGAHDGALKMIHFSSKHIAEFGFDKDMQIKVSKLLGLMIPLIM